MHQIGRLWREGSAALSDEEVPSGAPPLAARLPPQARQQLRAAAAQSGRAPQASDEARADAEEGAELLEPVAAPAAGAEENPAHILVAFASFASHKQVEDGAPPPQAECVDAAGEAAGETAAEVAVMEAEVPKEEPAQSGAQDEAPAAAEEVPPTDDSTDPAAKRQKLES